MSYFKAFGLPEPVEEHRFHPVRRWRFDYAWPNKKVALEVEGGTWSGGRHTRGSGFEGDCLKYSEAAIMGWKVIRCTTKMMRECIYLDLVKRALDEN